MHYRERRFRAMETVSSMWVHVKSLKWREFLVPRTLISGREWQMSVPRHALTRLTTAEGKGYLTCVSNAFFVSVAGKVSTLRNGRVVSTVATCSRVGTMNSFLNAFKGPV